MTQLWIGPIDESNLPDVGSIHFLVEIRKSGGFTRHDLRDTPAYTNQSMEPRLEGWCGTYNDVATFGRGLVKVGRVAKNGRVLLNTVDSTSPEGRAYLEDMGYPDLT